MDFYLKHKATEQSVLITEALKDTLNGVLEDVDEGAGAEAVNEAVGADNAAIDEAINR